MQVAANGPQDEPLEGDTGQDEYWALNKDPVSIMQDNDMMR